MNGGKILRTAGLGLITSFILVAVYMVGVEDGRTGRKLSVVGTVMGRQNRSKGQGGYDRCSPASQGSGHQVIQLCRGQPKDPLSEMLACSKE